MLFSVGSHIDTDISLTADPGQSEARLNWVLSAVNNYHQAYGPSDELNEMNIFPVGATSVEGKGTGPCENVTFVYNISVLGKININLCC